MKRKVEEYNLRLWTESARYARDPTVTSALPKTLNEANRYGKLKNQSQRGSAFLRCLQQEAGRDPE
jgi:hypothetical protein